MISNPTAIRSAFVAALKNVSALVALMGGDAANIIEYDDDSNGDLNSTIVNDVGPLQMLVYIDSIQPRGFPARIRVGVSLAIKAPSVWAVYAAICNGLGPDGVKLIGSTILQGFQPMEIPSCDRTGIIIGDTTTLDYFVIRTGFTDLGF